MRYPTRNHALVPAVEWVLSETMLRLEEAKGSPREIPLGQVRELRLDFAPTRAERNRFRCRLVLGSGETLTFFSRTYQGFYNFADTSAAYVAFVHGLVDALRRHAPGCRFMAGPSWLVYLFNAAVTAFIGVCFAAISWFLFRVGLTWMIAIKILLIIVYVPTLIYFLVRNRPRAFAPEAIPGELMPTVEAVAAPEKILSS